MLVKTTKLVERTDKLIAKLRAIKSDDDPRWMPLLHKACALLQKLELEGVLANYGSDDEKALRRAYIRLDKASDRFVTA